MAKGKFHGGITAQTPSGIYTQLIALAGILDRRRRLRQAQRLTRIELQKVDGLGHIGIGLNPVLAHLVGQPGAELKFALANQLRRLQQQRRALFHRHVLPGRKRFQRRLHRPFGVFQPSLLVHAHHLRRPRRIQRLDLVRRARPLPTDDQLILVAEHIAHPGQRSLHGMHVFRIVEIDERFVAEGSAGRNRLNDGADLSGWHNTRFYSLTHLHENRDR